MLLLLLIVLLIFTGVPVVFAMLLGLTAYILIADVSTLTMIPIILSYTFDSFPLLAIPLFILSAEIMNTTGVTEKIFTLFRSLFGHVRGSLGYVNVLSSMFFAGMSGSGVADAAGLGKVEMRAMLSEGYSRGFSAAVTASSTTIGPVIPPSVGVIILAYVTNNSVGQLLLAGIVPGIAMGLGLMLVVFVMSLFRDFPKHDKASFSDVRMAFRDAALAVLTPGILILGIVSGVFSPTEAATVCVVYAAALGVFVYKSLNWENVFSVLTKTAIDSSAVLFLAGAAKVIGFLIVMDGVPGDLLSVVQQLPVSETLLAMALLMAVVVMGCLVDDLSLLLIAGPILAPIGVQLGFDPVHFGILFLCALSIGMITPPVGIGMFVVCSIARTPVSTFAKEVWPFLVVLIGIVLLLLLTPELVMFLPGLVAG